MEKELKQSIQLNREQLKSIDIREILELDEEKLNDAELQARAGSAHAFYKTYFDKVIKLMTFLQTMKMGKEAETEGQMLFGRGTLNGLYLIEEWMKQQESISMEKFAPEENIKDITEDNPKIGE